MTIVGLQTRYEVWVPHPFAFCAKGWESTNLYGPISPVRENSKIAQDDVRVADTILGSSSASESSRPEGPARTLLPGCPILGAASPRQGWESTNPTPFWNRPRRQSLQNSPLRREAGVSTPAKSQNQRGALAPEGVFADLGPKSSFFGKLFSRAAISRETPWKDKTDVSTIPD